MITRSREGAGEFSQLLEGVEMSTNGQDKCFQVDWSILVDPSRPGLVID
jgi:hypothetical protein